MLGGAGLVAAAGRRRLLGPDTRLLLIGDSLAVGLDPHLEALAAEDSARSVGKGLAVGDVADAVELKPGDDAASVPEDKQRVSLKRLLAEYAAKLEAEPVKGEVKEEEAAWIR